MPSIDGIHECLGFLTLLSVVVEVATLIFLPVARVQIFAQAKATISNAPKHALKCCKLLLHGMSSVVDKNVQLLLESLPERRIPLVTNYNVNPNISPTWTVVVVTTVYI
jgi:hypothetical protein